MEGSSYFNAFDSYKMVKTHFWSQNQVCRSNGLIFTLPVLNDNKFDSLDYFLCVTKKRMLKLNLNQTIIKLSLSYQRKSEREIVDIHRSRSKPSLYYHYHIRESEGISTSPTDLPSIDAS